MPETVREVKVLKSIQSLIILAQLNQVVLDGAQIDHSFALEGQDATRDEPESHLDFRNQLNILKVIQHLAKEKNIACIMNTHYPDHALRVADKCLLLRDADTRAERLRPLFFWRN